MLCKKHTRVTNNINDVSVVFYSSKPACTNQGPETESFEWNSANIQFNIHTCAFPTVKKKSFTSQSNNLGKHKSTTYSQEE